MSYEPLIRRKERMKRTDNVLYNARMFFYVVVAGVPAVAIAAVLFKPVVQIAAFLLSFDYNTGVLDFEQYRATTTGKIVMLVIAAGWFLLLVAIAAAIHDKARGTGERGDASSAYLSLSPSCRKKLL